MIKQKDLVLAAHLRQNSRERLTTISRKTGMPVSTLFDRLKMNVKGIVSKNIALLNWEKLGFSTRATVLVKAKSEKRDALREHLVKALPVNSLYRINNGYDFIIECICKSIAELEFFLEDLEHKHGVKNKEVHYIIEDVKKEAFLSDPKLVPALFGGEQNGK